jgi:hypothetical protein
MVTLLVFLVASINLRLSCQQSIDRFLQPARTTQEMNQVPHETAPVPEYLVIITSKEPEENLRWLREHYDVTQSVSKRVFLVRGDPSGLSVPKREGLHIFSTPDVPEQILNSLDDRESLFVSAWRTRLQQQPKKRAGDGLDWDHPGFTPPR